jgi:hypothetical protein
MCLLCVCMCVCVQVVDVSYGGDNGFNQAIQLSADALANVKVGCRPDNTLLGKRPPPQVHAP